MRKLTVAENLHFVPVDEGIYVGWNRFWPSIFILNDEARNLLEQIRNGEDIETDEEIEAYLEECKKYHFLFDGDTDPSRENFIKDIRKNLKWVDDNAREFFQKEKDYDALKLITDDCNLACSYCVNQFGKKPETPRRPEHHIRAVVDDCVDQYFARKIANGKTGGELFFNGGEILLEWPLIRRTVERIAVKYKDVKMKYGINTNLTLLTREIAEFFKKYQFKVHISIDGYPESHNRTRIYHNGNGSFDDIMEKVKLYREVFGEDGMPMYQGTIEDPEQFDPEEVYKMEKYGFKAARLAPNLLGSTEEDAAAKAEMMAKFLELNDDRTFKVTEMIFTRMKKKVNLEEYRFVFNCRGLSAAPTMGIDLNLSTLSVSQICGFTAGTALPLDALDGDIYSPKLWEVSYRFIKQRMDRVLEHCLDCRLAAICMGGCILSGLDKWNRLNQPACAYQKEMWKTYIRKAYRDSPLE